MELPDDFRDLLLELRRAEVEFVVVGGYAVGFHGHARATKDIDVLVRPGPANAARIVRALHAFGVPVHQLGIEAKDFESEGKVVQLGVAPVRVDLLTSVDGISFDDAAKEGRSVEIDGVTIPVIGLDALLSNKRASGRLQDLADVAMLERIREARVGPSR